VNAAAKNALEFEKAGRRALGHRKTAFVAGGRIKTGEYFCEKIDFSDPEFCSQLGP
jgi:hypothetical protein